ncbi:MAG TPA: hypothetical protein VFV30_03930 [Novosphingobium sp.]|nr:hypothetical protein [Novosphingobium sp.]
MNTVAGGKSTGGAWGWVAILPLLALGGWQLGLFDGLGSKVETVDQAWFDGYTDRFLSEETTVTVVSKANRRLYPTSQKTGVIGSYPTGARLRGRWVAGPDPAILWFKTSDGSYVWQGNLDGDRTVMAAAAKAAASGSAASEPANEAAVAAADAAAAASAAASAAPKASESAPAPAKAAAPAPAAGYDPAMAEAIRRAVPDAALAGEIVRNAEVFAPRDSAGGRTLQWAICSTRCDFDFSTTVVLTGSGRRASAMVCVSDGRRMNGWSEWYVGGREAGRTPGLCPSRLAAVKAPS